MEGTNFTPDLQSILSTLAQFAPPVQNAAAVERPPAPASTGDNNIEHRIPASTVQEATQRVEDPRLQLRPQSRSAATASPKPIDPATITTWQDGLRCVTKIAAQNAQFASSIKKMMADQRRNEQRWYSERQNLKLTQANRATSSARAQSILQGLVGAGASQPASEANRDASNMAELAAFDRKIYDAQVQMESAMTRELKGLGVPFFGTDSNLVVSDEEDPARSGLRDNQPTWSPLVTERQLQELRRRMVGHLEDLYRD